MKACTHIRELLSLFLEGETSPEETRRVTEHLAACRECARALEEAKKTLEHIKNLDEVEPPPFFTQRVMAHIREEAERSRASRLPSPVSRLLSRLFYPLHIKIPVQAVALVLVAGLAFMVYRSIEPEMKLSSAPTETTAPALRDEVAREPQKRLVAPEPPEQRAPLKEKAGVPDSAKEEARISTTPVPAKIVEKKSEAPAAKPSQEPTVAFAPAPKESPQLQKAPSAPSPARAKESAETRQTRDAESLGVASGAAKDRMDRAATPPAREYKAAAKGIERIEFFVRASDVGSVANEVETVLVQMGAKQIERDQREAGVVIRGVVENRKLPDLVETLRSLGEMRTMPVYPSTAQGTSEITIRIEP